MSNLLNQSCICNSCNKEKKACLQMKEYTPKTISSSINCDLCLSYQKTDNFCSICKSSLCLYCLYKSQHCADGCDTIFCPNCQGLKCQACKQIYCESCFNRYTCPKHCHQCSQCNHIKKSSRDISLSCIICKTTNISDFCFECILLSNTDNNEEVLVYCIPCNNKIYDELD